ncbi:uncharacterized protein LOC135201179 [Macrobrachium nipponense]|uniref:uncharacterized protein LOC135201179 n=1 Tax=Macrobrachium nipponense TaxID=159736 RepID=UPI0030C823A9
MAHATLCWNQALPIKSLLPSQSPAYPTPNGTEQTALEEEGGSIPSPPDPRPRPHLGRRNSLLEEGGCVMSLYPPDPLPTQPPHTTDKRVCMRRVEVSCLPYPSNSLPTRSPHPTDKQVCMRRVDVSCLPTLLIPNRAGQTGLQEEGGCAMSSLPYKYPIYPAPTRAVLPYRQNPLPNQPPHNPGHTNKKDPQAGRQVGTKGSACQAPSTALTPTFPSFATPDHSHHRREPIHPHKTIRPDPPTIRPMDRPTADLPTMSVRVSSRR